MRRAGVDVDVHPVGLVVDHLDRGTGGSQNLRPDDAAGAIGAIEEDACPARADRPRELHPMPAVIVQQAGGIERAAELLVIDATQLVGAPDELLQLVLDRIVELQPTFVEDLEPVVLGRVVRRGDHDPRREAAVAGEVGQGRRRDDPGTVDVHPHAGRPGRDRGHEHVPGTSRVLADDDRVAGSHEPFCGGAPKRECRRWAQVDVGDATDPVRAEQARHRLWTAG